MYYIKDSVNLCIVLKLSQLNAAFIVIDFLMYRDILYNKSSV